MQTNLAMMRNLMDPLFERATRMRHVSFLQGTKAYGAHVHRLKVPAREDTPRDPHENFYWLQEDYIRGRRAGAPWTFTIWRPQVVFGQALGVAMNLMPIIGVYGAICRELGLPFVCPASTATSSRRWMPTSSPARWPGPPRRRPRGTRSSTSPTATCSSGRMSGQRSPPRSASSPRPATRCGSRPSCPSTPTSGTASAPEHGLTAPPMAELVGQSHHYADFLFALGATGPISPALVSTIKLRQAGFGDCVDTEVMFRRHLGRLIERRVLPRP